MNRRAPLRIAAAAAALVAHLVLGATAQARTADDGAYGRFDGDLDVRAQLGPGLVAGQCVFVAGASAQYLSTAGVYAFYSGGLGNEGAPAAVTLGVDLSPLFLARYTKDLEHLTQFVDLILDSVALEFGAVWTESKGRGFRAPDRPGAELAVSMALPVLNTATGPFLGLRAGLRWIPAGLEGEPARYGMDPQGVLSVTLGWRQILRTHLVDLHDERGE